LFCFLPPFFYDNTHFPPFYFLPFPPHVRFAGKTSFFWNWGTFEAPLFVTFVFLFSHLLRLAFADPRLPFSLFLLNGNFPHQLSHFFFSFPHSGLFKLRHF